MPHYRQLFRAVEEAKPKRILEIGVWNGVHGAEMIRTAQRFNPDIEYWGFDLFAPCPEFELPKQPPTMDSVIPVLADTGATVHLVQGNTRETLPAADLPPMDFIFLDGGHSLETIASDWVNCRKLMHAGTVVILDDYYPDREDAGAKPLMDQLMLDPSLKVEILQPPTIYPTLIVNMVKVVLA